MSASTSTLPRGLDTEPLSLRSSRWADLLVLVVLALLLRLTFFNGPFGSDDVVYLERALQVSRGEWTSSDYNGALRYGFNLPAGLFLYLFGPSVAAANLWSLLCSVGEVVLVYVLAAELWGRRAAVFAALVLACLPLHIAVATRIHADPVVSFFLTSSFVLFFFAGRSHSRGLHFATGLAMGAVFWTKELAAVTLFAFLAYPLVWRRLERAWAWVVAGGMCMLLLHLAFMAFLSGDPLHLVRVVSSAVGRNFIAEGQGEDSPWYYFRYLFLDIKHTWIGPWIAALTLLGLAVSRRARGGAVAGTGFVVIWLLALIAVQSFWPVSLSPLRFAMKQSNYMTLFLAPIALLAGLGLSRLPHRAGLALLLLTVAGGVLLGAFEQADYRVFTANSRSAHAFALEHPQARVVGTPNNHSVSGFLDLLRPPGSPARRVGGYDDLDAPASPGERDTLVIVDPQTRGWFAGPIVVDAPLPCWRQLGTIEPDDSGAGASLAAGALAALQHAPAALRERMSGRLAALARPAVATVYAVDPADPWCGSPVPGSRLKKKSQETP